MLSSVLLRKAVVSIDGKICETINCDSDEITSDKFVLAETGYGSISAAAVLDSILEVGMMPFRIGDARESKRKGERRRLKMKEKRERRNENAEERTELRSEKNSDQKRTQKRSQIKDKRTWNRK